MTLKYIRIYTHKTLTDYGVHAHRQLSPENDGVLATVTNERVNLKITYIINLAQDRKYDNTPLYTIYTLQL